MKEIPALTHDQQYKFKIKLKRLLSKTFDEQYRKKKQRIKLVTVVIKKKD
jgi:hypothetical protein